MSDGANVLVGDMNCGNIDWVNLSAPNDGVHDAFLNFTVKNGYSQLITEPTRDSKILDVLLSNEPISISDCQGPLQRHVAMSVLLYCFILPGPVDVPGGTFSRAQQAYVTSRI